MRRLLSFDWWVTYRWRCVMEMIRYRHFSVLDRYGEWLRCRISVEVFQKEHEWDRMNDYVLCVRECAGCLVWQRVHRYGWVGKGGCRECFNLLRRSGICRDQCDLIFVEHWRRQYGTLHVKRTVVLLFSSQDFDSVFKQSHPHVHSRASPEESLYAEALIPETTRAGRSSEMTHGSPCHRTLIGQHQW